MLRTPACHSARWQTEPTLLPLRAERPKEKGRSLLLERRRAGSPAFRSSKLPFNASVELRRPPSTLGGKRAARTWTAQVAVSGNGFLWILFLTSTGSGARAPVAVWPTQISANSGCCSQPLVLSFLLLSLGLYGYTSRRVCLSY